MTKIIDYNGEGNWSREAILGRYAQYCEQLKIDRLDLNPAECSEGNTKWVYPVMDEIIQGIEQGDAAC